MKQLQCECGRNLGYELRHAGKTVRCSACDRLLVVPDELSDQTADEVEATAPRSAQVVSPSLVVREEQPAKLDVEAESYQDQPRRRKRRAASEQPPIGFMHTVGALLYNGPAAAVLCVMAALGIGLLVYGFSEGKLATGATEVPQTISCEKLIAGGIPSNPHVLVTDVFPGDNYVYTMKVTKSEKASGNTAGKPWESVYVPLLALTPELKTRLARGETISQKPPGNQIRLLLLSYKAKNESELRNSFPQDNVQGMIVNSIRKLDTSTENLLRKAYPGVDLSQVLILEDRRKPTSQTFATAMIVGGALLIVSALFMGIIAVAYRPRE